METERIKISNQGHGVDEAMAVADKAAVYGDLDDKQKIRLRLLSEELIGLLRGVAGDVEAYFKIVQNDKKYELHLNSDIVMNQELHKQLVALSTSGTNAAAAGFMGKLREFIAVSLLPTVGEGRMNPGISLGLINTDNVMGYQSNVDAYMWSMQQYKESLDELDDPDDAEINTGEAWDELEKSIVAQIADEVKVRVVGSDVEIIIFKDFS
ncbi:MAG: hypothetical protein J5517_04955 [Eubacterium sp.]|nr:hypothetical protein [Eubacterium sp.]